MLAEWTNSSAALPNEGDPVEFVLDGREIALGGAYDHQTFRSRWSAYEVQRVRAWRPVDSGTAVDSPTEPADRLAHRN